MNEVVVNRDKLDADVACLSYVVEQHLAAEEPPSAVAITDDEYHAFQVKRGVLAQRATLERSIVRAKVPYGCLTSSQLRVLAQITLDFSDGVAHITTRQGIEFADVLAERVPACVAALAEGGLTTREAGGNSILNIAASPLAGVDPNEAFDVTPFARALTERFLYDEFLNDLPRKVKIALSGGDDRALAAVSDIGLVARAREFNGWRERGFEVRIGGGLGAWPENAVVLFDFVALDCVVPVVEAILRVYHDRGNRRNRDRSRVKYLVKQSGLENIRLWVEGELHLLPRVRVDETPRTQYLQNGYDVADAPLVDEIWRERAVVSQKQANYVAVYIWLPAGQIKAAQLEALAEAADHWGEGEVRATSEQNVVLRGIHVSNLGAIYAFLREKKLAQPLMNTLSDAVACPGADSCRVAITHSRALVAELSTLLKEKVPEDLGNATVKVSGCPHSCGQHHIATLGLHGATKKVEGRNAPFYNLFVGGHVNEEGAQFGRNVGRVPARRVPRIMQEIMSIYRDHHRPDEDFETFLRGVEVAWLQNRLGELLLETPLHGEDKFFYDWGENEPFSLVLPKRLPQE